MKIFVNGSFQPADQPALLASEHGYTVGDGVFETIKTINNIAYAVTRHLRRLEISAKGLGLANPPLEHIERAIDEMVVQEPIAGLGRIRITWSGGPGPAGSMRSPEMSPTLVISHTAAPVPATLGKAVILPFPRNERSPLSGIKSTSYAENVLALAYAKERGGDEGIFCDTQGRISEGSGTNIILLLDGEFVTPSLNCGVLDGVTRRLAIEWFNVSERQIPGLRLFEADALLLTSSLRNLQVVSHLEGREIPIHPSALVLSAAFTARLLQEIDPL